MRKEDIVTAEMLEMICLRRELGCANAPVGCETRATRINQVRRTVGAAGRKHHCQVILSDKVISIEKQQPRRLRMAGGPVSRCGNTAGLTLDELNSRIGVALQARHCYSVIPRSIIDYDESPIVKSLADDALDRRIQRRGSIECCNHHINQSHLRRALPEF